MTDPRQELLARLDTALQLVGLMLDDARAGAPGQLVADLDRVRGAALKLRDRVEDFRSDEDDTHHRLLTPLTHFIGYCELIAEEAGEPWASRFRADVGQLLAAGGQMRAGIDQLLRHKPPRSPSESHFDVGPKHDAIAGRILAVDDEELNRHLLQRWLTRQGHDVTFASNGVEALELVRAAPFDLVLLDVMMPEMNGFEVLVRLKADPATRHIPVIVISALTEFDGVVRCIENGAEDYLPKPFQPVLLDARIGASLEKKRLRDREDELLHLMLPGEIVKELRETKTVAPRRYDGVAVLFADVAGFTRFCDGHDPEDVVPLLQALVLRFEAIAESCGVQKIKTIGDSFMAAAGLLRPVPNPVRACVECAGAMIDAAAELPPRWPLRIGIHYGKVVAGLLGTRYDVFDLWGDTVNTASRVEHAGADGSITLSGAAWERIAAEAEGEPLGPVEVKGKLPVEMVRFRGFR